MSSMAVDPNPQTSSGAGGAAMISAPPTDDPNFQVSPIPAFGVPSGYGLPSAINLGSVAPAGAYTDSQYLSDDASLRAGIAQQYANILQQLGYQDPNTGHVIPGSVVQDANIQLAQFQHDLQQAAMHAIGQLQNQGTLFSGQRGIQMAEAQYPTMQNIGKLGVDTSRSLSDLYHQAQNLVTSYNTGQNQNLAAAAARNLQQIQNQNLIAALAAGGGLGGAGASASSGGGGGAPPPPAPTVTSPSTSPLTAPSDGTWPNMLAAVQNASRVQSASTSGGTYPNELGAIANAAKVQAQPVSGYSAASRSALH